VRKATRSGLRVMEAFVLRGRGRSVDGRIHSDGEVLCCDCGPIARWIGQGVYLLPPECSTEDKLVRIIRAKLLANKSVRVIGEV
jgi:hypothetical protein